MPTINEAIEDINTIIRYPKTPIGAHTLKSIQLLGGEALKRLQAYREGIDIPFDELLPGETEE